MIQKIMVIAIVVLAATYLVVRIRKSLKKGPTCACDDPGECPYSGKELKERVCTMGLEREKDADKAGG